MVATNFGYGAHGRSGGGPNRAGQSRKWGIAAAEASLRRLSTDYLDIIYCHRADLEAPLEEPLRAIGSLIATGKLRDYSLANLAGWRIAEVCRIADALGMDRPVVSQPLYHLVERRAEVEQIPAAAIYGLPDAVMSACSRPNDARRAFASSPRSAGARRSWSLHDRLCPCLGAAQSAGQLGHCRAPHERAVSGLPCRNARRTGPAEEAFVAALVPPGHASPPGYTDAAYSVEGRVSAS